MIDQLKKRRTLVVTIVVAAAALAYVFLGFLPGRAAVRSMRSELLEKQRFIGQAKRLEQPARQTLAEIEATRTFIHDWKVSAPAESNMASLFAEITQHADGAGVVNLRCEPQAHLRHDAVGQIPVELVFDGEYSQAFDLVRRIESLAETIWITRVRLEPLRGDRKTGGATNGRQQLKPE